MLRNGFPVDLAQNLAQIRFFTRWNPEKDKGLENQALVLVDDVLNSGGTLIASVHHFIKKPMKKIKTVVLIDRNHRTFPIAADFVGMSLATTLQEHVEVRSEHGLLKEVVLN